MPLNRKHLFILVILTLSLTWRGSSSGQTYLFFQDSPTTGFYDYSWMELTPPSELERLGNELRKFPVESIFPAVQGMNSLRLSWRSESSGDWNALAAALNWETKNISQADTLMFWLCSTEGLSANNLPKIFLEDVNNSKTTKHDFSAWSPSTLPAGSWVRIAIPMTQFLNAGDPVDFTKIKTIGFAQNANDNLSHTLLIDDMRAFTGDGNSPPASPPTGLTAEGFDSHIELTWNPNPEDYINGYQIQRSVDEGNTFNTIAVTNSTTTQYTDWVRALGTTVNAIYRIQALNANNEPSIPSDPANASTSVFSDEELLDMVQKSTFRYFWDFAHPFSGMARERNSSGDVVTTGGSGFGIMAILTGIERGFITREQGITRMIQILDFLESADRFHGAWPHWLDGNTGEVVAFSQKDNGGDLVETGFLVQGLLAARQYFNQTSTEEQNIVEKITTLWEGVEWDWYTKDNSGVLYWHWSPDYQWQLNMQIRGWNEALIVYMLAIASPTHSIPASYWNSGWAGNSNYINGNSFYGYKLDVGWDRGGPLFFAHYSFLGFDARNKKDSFTNYYILNLNHTLINRAYCIDNPLNHTGYGENCWGLTASDDPFGYMAHEPANDRDNGTITPTAALSSMPYTPVESTEALKHFYRELGQKTWGWMGFYDAFNQREDWWASSYLAIDQGPIIVMIENYRSQLLWNSFMANPEIGPMLENIGFVYDPNDVNATIAKKTHLTLMPNPVTGTHFNIEFNLPAANSISISILSLTGKKIATLVDKMQCKTGMNRLTLEHGSLNAGFYLLTLTTGDNDAETIKLIIR